MSGEAGTAVGDRLIVSRGIALLVGFQDQLGALALVDFLDRIVLKARHALAALRLRVGAEQSGQADAGANQADEGQLFSSSWSTDSQVRQVSLPLLPG